MAQMAQKGASTTLIARRLHALRVGFAVLENAWDQKPHHYTREDLAQAREVLVGLGPSIQNVYARSGARSPQRTLLERRINALELAVRAIDELLEA